MSVYELLDPGTGELVFVGTPSECAEFCGGTATGFHKRYTPGKYHGYDVRLVPEAKPLGTELKKVADAWDAFCDPIRKEFGIQVRRGDNG